MNIQSIKEMKRIVKILLVVFIILILSLSFFLYRNFTGQAVADGYTYTKAICNETNYCQDYKIICNGENLIDLIPISSASVQNPKDWKDSRENKNYDKLCDQSN